MKYDAVAGLLWRMEKRRESLARRWYDWIARSKHQFAERDELSILVAESIARRGDHRP